MISAIAIRRLMKTQSSSSPFFFCNGFCALKFINNKQVKSAKGFKENKTQKMPFISTFKFSILPPPVLSIQRLFPLTSTSNFRKFPHCPILHTSISSSRKTLLQSKSSEEESDVSVAEDEWLQKLPDKKKALYSHSLPCAEAWLRSLGFYQSRDDRAVWFIEKLDWHAQLSLDVTDLYIRYLKSGAGNLEKDVERRFSYALSREDIENAILGGP